MNTSIPTKATRGHRPANGHDAVRAATFAHDCLDLCPIPLDIQPSTLICVSIRPRCLIGAFSDAVGEHGRRFGRKCLSGREGLRTRLPVFSPIPSSNPATSAAHSSGVPQLPQDSLRLSSHQPPTHSFPGNGYPIGMIPSSDSRSEVNESQRYRVQQIVSSVGP